MQGCDPCSCDPTGALNSTCDVNTGQCFCREGVTGQKCDVCEAYHYGFSLDGCQPCDCDPVGSVSLQCIATGQCQVRGRGRQSSPEALVLSHSPGEAL